MNNKTHIIQLLADIFGIVPLQSWHIVIDKYFRNMTVTKQVYEFIDIAQPLSYLVDNKRD